MQHRERVQQARTVLNARPISSLEEVAAHYSWRGELFAAAGNWDSAVCWYERAVSYLPHDAHFRLRLAQCYYAAWRLPEAITAACEAIALTTNQARTNASHFHDFQNSPDFHDFHDFHDFQNSSLFPGSLVTPSGSEGEVTRVKTVSSLFPIAFSLVGAACTELGDLPGAVRAWTSLLNLDPANPDAWRGLITAGSAMVSNSNGNETDSSKTAWEAILEAKRGRTVCECCGR